MNFRPLVALLALVAAASCVPHEAERPAAVRPDPTVVEAKAFVDQLAFGAPWTMPATMPTAGAPVAPAVAPTVATTAAPPFTVAAQSPDDASRAVDCLTTAIYYEARSEPRDGQRAVAQVVLNRVRDRAFPASVCGVVYQGSQRRTGCQFSFTCDGSMLRGRRDGASWLRARDVAAAALAGDVYAPVGSATFYHTTAISPWWAPSLSRIATVGAHIFYRWQSAVERSLAFRQSYTGVESAPAPRTIVPGVTLAAEAAPTAEADGWRTQEIAGVTIHRAPRPSSAPTTPAPVAATAVAVATPAAASPPRPTRAIVAGVRVHRNVDFQAVADET